MADEQFRAEVTDADELGEEFPPERPMAVDRGDDSEPSRAGSDARDTDPLESGREDDARGAERDLEVTLLDQTADADPEARALGAEALDAGETGDSMDGTPSEDDPMDDRLASDRVPPPAEEEAMHVIDEPEVARQSNTTVRRP